MCYDRQGAYNMTRESAAKSLEAQRRTDSVVGILAETEKEVQEVRGSFMIDNVSILFFGENLFN